MTVNNIKEKIKLYILSLWLLFFLVFILKLQIPIYFGADYVFIGLFNLIKMNIIPIICLIFLLLGFWFYKGFDYKLKGSSQLPFRIISVENANYEHLTFLETCIIPIICFNFDDIRYILVVVVILCIIGTIYVKTNKFYANPTLALLGFKIYTATKENESMGLILLTKDSLVDKDDVTIIKLDEKIFFCKKIEEQK